jgi:hypothetical protein
MAQHSYRAIAKDGKHTQSHWTGTSSAEQRACAPEFEAAL